LYKYSTNQIKIKVGIRLNLENSSENKALQISDMVVFEVSDINKIINGAFEILLTEKDTYTGTNNGFFF